MPPAAISHDQDSGNGRLIPVVAVEQLAGSLGQWFGLTTAELQSALPNIVNFPSPTIDLFLPGAVA
jgi:hypothetical protein